MTYSLHLAHPAGRVGAVPSGAPHVAAAQVAPLAFVALLLAATLATARPLAAQQTRTVRGAVIDSETRQPVDGVLVRATGTESRAFTDETGAFRLDDVPAGPQTFVLQRIGYGVSEVELDPPGDEAIIISIKPVPVQLPGLVAEARTFAARLDSITHYMDRNVYGRYWTFTGTLPRVAGLEEMRKVHHLDDPELALRALRVQPSLDHDCSIQDGAGIVGPGVHRRRVMAARQGRPMTLSTIVYIDGEKFGYRGQGCDSLRRMDTSSICRMELMQIRGRSYRLMVWTCAFLARLAAGDKPVPELMEVELLWPDFMRP